MGGTHRGWAVGNEWDLWDSCDLWVGLYEPCWGLQVQRLEAASRPPGSWILAPGSLLLTDYFPQKVQRSLSHHLFECRSIGREEQLFHL
jgi:hypothetical protein